MLISLFYIGFTLLMLSSILTHFVFTPIKAGKESDSSRFCLYLFHNDQIKIDMEKLLEQINDRIAAFQKDAYLQ